MCGTNRAWEPGPHSVTNVAGHIEVKTMPNFRARLWPPGTTRIRTLGWAAVIGLIAIALLAPASPALSNDTPGNNGTVKIHEGNTENDPGEVRNEPHVCTFHLHFYFSDPEQAGTWEIQEWSPGDKGTVVLSGIYDTQGDGEDRQPPDGVYTLDPGHYKLFWDGDLDTNKHDKMKVFWVDCGETGVAPETPTPTPPGGGVGPIQGTPTPTPPEGGVGPIQGTPTPTPPQGGVGPIEGTPVPTPEGAVAGVTAVPRTTLPPTDTANQQPSAGPGGLWAILLLLAVLGTTVTLATVPVAALQRTRRRH